jgi:hypothetical protein
MSEVEFLWQTGLDPGEGAGDLAGDEGLTAAGRFVIEENAVAGMHLVAFTVIDGHPVAVELGRAVGTARIKRRVFALRDGLHEPVHFAAGGLVKAGLGGGLANGFEETRGAEAGDVARIFRNVEADADVALRAKMVNLVGLDVVEQAGERSRIAEIAVVKEKLHTMDVGIHVKMIDALGVERAGAADDAVDLVAFIEQ